MSSANEKDEQADRKVMSIEKVMTCESFMDERMLEKACGLHNRRPEKDFSSNWRRS
jgi:hypothetical protein